MNNITGNNHVIARAPYLIGDQPVDIMAAAKFRLEQLPTEIDFKKALLQNEMDTHEIKVKQLQAKGFSDVEIESILPAFNIQTSDLAGDIEELSEEVNKLNVFLENPDHNRKFLCNTALQYMFAE